MSNLAGIVGGLALGWLARQAGLKRLTAGMVAGLGLATAVFGVVPPSLPLLMGAAGICGFFLTGGIAGIFATLAISFAAPARALGAAGS